MSLRTSFSLPGDSMYLLIWITSAQDMKNCTTVDWWKHWFSLSIVVPCIFIGGEIDDC